MSSDQWFTPICRAMVVELLRRYKNYHRGIAFALIIESLFRAARGTAVYNGITLERGQFLFGLDELAQMIGASKSQIRTLISTSKTAHFLTVKTTHHGSIATIENFGRYVIDGKENDTPNSTLLDTQLDIDIAHRSHTDDTLLKHKAESSKASTKETTYIPGTLEPEPTVDGKETKKKLVMKSSYHESLDEIAYWFYQHDHVVRVEPDTPQWWDSLNTCRIILEKQMASIPAPDGQKDPVVRLRRLLEYAVLDDPATTGKDFGWKPQIRSLASLSGTNRNKLPKWANVEVSAVKSGPLRFVPRHNVPPPEPDYRPKTDEERAASQAKYEQWKAKFDQCKTRKTV